MTLNGAIMQLVELRESSMMPEAFKPCFDKVIETISECEEPSAQPNIIHCGECKYYHDSDGCFFSTATTGADGFCHWAERKEGEQDASTVLPR